MTTLNKPLRALDKVVVSDEKKRQLLNSVLTKKEKKKVFSMKMVAPLVLASLLLMMFPMNKQMDNTIVSHVALDLNPSIVLDLNAEDKVVGIVAVNDDAKDIVNNVTVNGLPVEEAMEVIFTNEIYKKYLNDGFLSVSVYSEQEDKSMRLKDKLEKSLKNRFSDECQIQHVDEKTWNSAKEMNVGVGKYVAIQEILVNNTTYSMDELKDMSMRDLKNITDGTFSGKGKYQNKRK